MGGIPSDLTGTGIYLRRIFSSWPAERVASVAARGPINQPDWTSCCEHYCLGDLELKVIPALRVFATPRQSQVLRPDFTQPSVLEVTKPNLGVKNFAMPPAKFLWRALLKTLGGSDLFYRVEVSKQLAEFILKFQPDVIYGHCASLTSVRILANIRRHFPIPLVVHCMDDWPTTIYKGSCAEGMHRKLFLKEFSQLIKSAALVIGICEEMANEYRDRYEREVHYLGMPVDLEAYEAVRRKNWTAGRPFRLQFAGRVGWALKQSLSDIAYAIGSLNSEGMDIVFDILTFNPLELDEFCRDSEHVHVKSAVEPRELAVQQALADVLIVCLDHGALPFTQARYSMPSKLPGCLASGTPILAYGPRGLPFIEYARRSGWGIVVDVCDPDYLKETIKSLVNSVQLREHYGRNALALASRNHDTKSISREFSELVVSATARDGNVKDQIYDADQSHEWH